MKTYSNIAYFKDKDKSFIAWISTLLKPINQEDQDYIYKEGDDVTEIYFLVKGFAGYVLPRLDNRVFLELKAGQHFGHSELATDRDFINIKKIKRQSAYKNLIRKFTVQSFENCEVLVLETPDLLKMKIEFPSAFV
jgi:CRP-like cAMP-binding protein